MALKTNKMEKLPEKEVGFFKKNIFIFFIYETISTMLYHFEKRIEHANF